MGTCRSRRDYKPQLGPKAAAAAQFAVDPLTGQQVRIEEMEEHMRISLLDPKWKEQKSIAEDRLKGSSNIAQGDAISSNLKSFAARRTDIFGDQEVAIGETVTKSAEQEQSDLRARVIWDGHSSSIASTASRAMATGGTDKGEGDKRHSSAIAPQSKPPPAPPPPPEGEPPSKKQKSEGS